MHPLEPVELSGELVAVEPLSAEHAAGLSVAADSEEVFAWLPHPRLADLDGAQAWIADALAVKEGIHRHEMMRRDGSWRDSVHYSILCAEWPAAKVGLRDRIAAVEAG